MEHYAPVREVGSWPKWARRTAGGVIGGFGYPLGIGLMVAGARSGSWGFLLFPVGLATLAGSQVAAVKIYRDTRRHVEPPLS